MSAESDLALQKVSSLRGTDQRVEPALAQTQWTSLPVGLFTDYTANRPRVTPSYMDDLFSLFVAYCLYAMRSNPTSFRLVDWLFLLDWGLTMEVYTQLSPGDSQDSRSLFRLTRRGVDWGLGAVFCWIVSAFWVIPFCYGQSPNESARNTRLVQVIQSMEPSVVALFSQTEQGIVSGSGSIVHPDGYVLTNNHVLPVAEGFALLHASRTTRFRVISRFPEADIALIQLAPSMQPFPTLPLGRSHDLKNGESVVVAGNPGGRGIVFTAGIVSSNQVLDGGPNALVMANYVNDRRDRFIQFDAASNRGNSGGPLVNMDGECIGIVVATVNGEQNVGLAIPIDRVRAVFLRMLQPEMIHRKSMGVRIDPTTPSAGVVEVEADSPAARSGLRPGDELVAVQGQTVRHGMDWWLALENQLPVASALTVGFLRDGLRQSTNIVPTDLLPLASVPAANAEPGLKYQFYEGEFNAMPNFSEMEANRHGIASNLDIERIAQGRPDYFAVVFEGLLKVDADGLYRIVLVSDDGSKLALHHQEIIDHDGNHPAKPAGHLLRLQEGFHPIRIEYFEGNGEQKLQCSLQPVDSRANITLESLPWVDESMLYHVP